MSTNGTNRDFITAERLRAAKVLAERVAREYPELSGSQCAERAVKAVFGSWLQDWSASIKPGLLPLYFQLINKVENRLDLHRRPKERAAEPIPPLPQCAPIPSPPQKPVLVHVALAMAA